MSGTLEVESSGVLVHLDGPVMTVTMNRPDVLNAMRPSTWRRLATIGANVPEHVRVVVVRGSGKSFCAGLDRRLLGGEMVDGEPPVTTLFELDFDSFDEQVAEYQEGFLWLRNPRFISLAVVQGHAIGGGFQLALACDLRVLASDASFCMREPALGIVPDVTGSKHLLEVVGYSRALEMTATARYIEADEAFASGLANVVAPLAELETAVASMIASLTAHPAGAVSATKELYLGAAERTFDQQRAWERRVQFDRFAALAEERQI